MANNFKALWRASASILGTFLAGILVSVSHHLYYASFEGTSAEGDRTIAGYRISNQSFAAAVGTAFSFVVRAFLLFAVSGAYVQLFWRAATHAQKVNTLEEIDTMFSILSDVFAFRQGPTWWRHPMLFLIALIAWLLPIAFTIPPASLSVVVSPMSTIEKKTVPNFDFASLRYVGSMHETIQQFYNASSTQIYTEHTYYYTGPSSDVHKVADLVARSGTILPITPPAANSSWQLDFYGPSLSCYPMDRETRFQVESNIANWLWDDAQSPTQDYRNCRTPMCYLAWSNTRKERTPFWDTSYEGFEAGQVMSSFSVAVMPDMMENGCDKRNLTTQSQPLGPGNMTFLVCDLYNSSYQASFNYESGRQSIAVQVDHIETVPTLNRITFPPVQDLATEPYTFDASILQQLSYTAIADAFYQNIAGSVICNLAAYLDTDNKVVFTVLLDTPELSFLSIDRDFIVGTTLQEAIWRPDNPEGQSIYNPRKVELGKSLQNALEEMFQNMTISLISSELLQPNMTSKFAPPMPNVTTTTYRPIYQYSPRQLWIAYGVAIAVSTLATFLGFLAIFVNNSNYSSNFSSVYRAAYGSKLSVTMRAEDAKAMDPLPRYLAKAALYITNANSNSSEQPLPSDQHPTSLAAMKWGLRKPLIGQGVGIVASQHSESAVADRSDAWRYFSQTRSSDVGTRRASMWVSAPNSNWENILVSRSLRDKR
ncbi:hypothetical protein F5Y10DRAFT_290393 [Nemania abortiva]|nr:hypothetical protein F5Y10DRAFT_290393 [Nemania abortiva]